MMKTMTMVMTTTITIIIIILIISLIIIIKLAVECTPFKPQKNTASKYKYSCEREAPGARFFHAALIAFLDFARPLASCALPCPKPVIKGPK